MLETQASCLIHLLLAPTKELDLLCEKGLDSISDSFSVDEDKQSVDNQYAYSTLSYNYLFPGYLSWSPTGWAPTEGGENFEGQ